MWIEGNSRRGLRCIPGPRQHCPQNLLMSQVQAIEVSNGKNGAPGAKSRRPFFRRTQNRKRHQT
jgi:hypothetical protein